MPLDKPTIEFRVLDPKQLSPKKSKIVEEIAICTVMMNLAEKEAVVKFYQDKIDNLLIELSTTN